ncbi:MAG: TOBE domain-containing protein [Actinobacteria bacterium]|nr:TOBE domain-containing protein [Actinomycetota bacterium]
MIRPENLELHPNKKGKAIVVSCEYFGHHQLVELRLESGALILSRLRSDQILRPGCRVETRIKGAPMVYLPG